MILKEIKLFLNILYFQTIFSHIIKIFYFFSDVQIDYNMQINL
jgi:hypothetical protein